MIYDIEITDFTLGARTSRTIVGTAEDAWEAACAARAGDESVLLVARRDATVSYGDFHIWLAGDRALVRLDEHREWFGIDADCAATASAGDIWFRDSDGASFPAQRAEAVARSQAFEALDYWLRTGKMLPSLNWT